MLNLLNSIPVGKIAYSAVLIALVIFLTREIYGIWFDSRMYVGKFDYFTEGKADSDLSAAFPRHVLAQHHMLRSALIEEAGRRQRERPAGLPAGAEVYHRLPSTLPGIDRWQSVLSEVELKIQSFDIGKLLSQLRTWVSPPEEISGFVEKTGTVVRSSVNWPHGQAAKATTNAPEQFETGPLSGDTSAAFAIAASIVWAQAAAADKNFHKISRETFVAWALAWWDYRTIRDRNDAGHATTDDDRTRWKQARTLIDKLAPQAETYPEIWRLRADIIELAPGGKPSTEDLDLARQDRQKYARAVGLPTTAAVATASEQEPRTGESAAERPVIRPGAVVWFTGGKGKDSFESAITVTALVIDASGRESLLVPDYVLSTGSGTSEVEFRLGSGGPVVARANKTHVVRPAAAVSNSEFYGVILAPLTGGVAYLDKFAGSVPVRRVGPLPAVGTQLQLLSSHGVTTTRLKAIQDGFAVVDGRVSRPGDGGAPVIDAEGNLIAMGYLGTESGSQFLPVKWVFDERQVNLAPSTAAPTR